MAGAAFDREQIREVALRIDQRIVSDAERVDERHDLLLLRIEHVPVPGVRRLIEKAAVRRDIGFLRFRAPAAVVLDDLVGDRVQLRDRALGLAGDVEHVLRFGRRHAVRMFSGGHLLDDFHRRDVDDGEVVDVGLAGIDVELLVCRPGRRPIAVLPVLRAQREWRQRDDRECQCEGDLP